MRFVGVMLVVGAAACLAACASEPKRAPRVGLLDPNLPACRPWEDPPYNDTQPCRPMGGRGFDPRRAPRFLGDGLDGGLLDLLDHGFRGGGGHDSGAPPRDAGLGGLDGLDAARAPTLVLPNKLNPWFVLTPDAGR